MNSDFFDEFASYLKIYDVYDNNGLMNLVRVGTHAEGGFFLPEKVLEISDAVIGYEVKEKFSFEITYENMTHKPSFIFACDECRVIDVKTNQTVENFVPECHGTFDFLPQRGAAKDDEIITSFQEQIEGLNLQNKKLVIKSDIEGAEMNDLSDVLDHSSSIVALAVSMHFNQDDQFLKALKLMKQIDQNFILVHLFNVNCLRKTFTSKNIIGEASRVMALSYVHRDLVSFNQLAVDQSVPSRGDQDLCSWMRNVPFQVKV
jgi:hypothetical protein